MEITKGENANQIFKHKDGCTWLTELPTGVGTWGCSCGLDKLLLELEDYELTAPTPPLDVARDAARYWRLRLLGCAPMESKQLENGTVLRFSNLDEFVDHDIKIYSSRGEAELYARRHIAPQPSRTYGDLPGSIRNMVESHEWDNKNISEQRDYALDMVDFLERELGNFRRNQAHAAIPAQPEKRDAKACEVCGETEMLTVMGRNQYACPKHRAVAPQSGKEGQ